MPGPPKQFKHDDAVLAWMDKHKRRPNAKADDFLERKLGKYLVLRISPHGHLFDPEFRKRVLALYPLSLHSTIEKGTNRQKRCLEWIERNKRWPRSDPKKYKEEYQYYVAIQCARRRKTERNVQFLQDVETICPRVWKKDTIKPSSYHTLRAYVQELEAAILYHYQAALFGTDDEYHKSGEALDNLAQSILAKKDTPKCGYQFEV
jgi:hypothetical protein